MTMDVIFLIVSHVLAFLAGIGTYALWCLVKEGDHRE